MVVLTFQLAADEFPESSDMIFLAGCCILRGNALRDSAESYTTFTTKNWPIINLVVFAHQRQFSSLYV